MIHVSHGYEDRARHIESMLGDKGLDFEYMLDGDFDEITPDQMKSYFAEPCAMSKGAISCAYKHLLACRAIVDRNLDGAVIMEDDAIIFKRFTTLLPEALKQLGDMGDAPAILSLEDTRLRFVPRSMRRKDRLVYPGDRDRFTGCFYINRAGAEAVVDFAADHLLDRPIDHFHRLMLDTGRLKYYWMQPAIATQGSFTGLFRSSITSRRERFIKPIKWKLKLAYRKLLYFLR